MKFLLAVMAAFALCAPAHAQRLYSQAELDALLAPIALQTDGVLSQVLMAATYPEDVAAAAAWSRANAHLRGDAAVRAADEQPWDPSVKSLLAFPELLARMDESPQWLRDLGEAFLGQQAQVMDTVQGLRQRAQANGQLVTSADTAVYQQGDAIVVQPRAQVVYVPYYDPYVVYGPWWWGPYYRPVVWRAWSPYPVFLAHGFFYSAPDWRHRHVRVVHRPVHVHHHHEHIVPGKWQHRAQVQRVRTPAALSRPVRDRVQPQVQPQVRPQVQPQARPQMQPQARPQMQPQARPQVQPHARPQVQPHAQTQVQPYVRVPEAQRKPIVQQHQPMPAANGYSHPNREPRREQRSEGQHNQRGREMRGGGEHRGGGERGGQRGHRG
jgi:hypothetical protein